MGWLVANAGKPTYKTECGMGDMPNAARGGEEKIEGCTDFNQDFFPLSPTDLLLFLYKNKIGAEMYGHVALTPRYRSDCDIRRVAFTICRLT